MVTNLEHHSKTNPANRWWLDDVDSWRPLALKESKSPTPASPPPNSGPMLVNRPAAPSPPPIDHLREDLQIQAICDTMRGSRNGSEEVIKYHYDVRSDTWTQAQATIIIDPTPFQEGTMRTAFHMLDLSKPEHCQHCVCKISKDPQEDTSTYFVDVEMQALAKLFADEFNKLTPPKCIDFLEASLMKCIERCSQPILAVEPYLRGTYIKHSNNYGFISEDDRSTPQAFSHFSYCRSKGNLLICDIQGVGDKYTDPQIHSRDGKGFGKGNLGVEGMVKFFMTHRCNAICRQFNLPPHQPKTVDNGTVAALQPHNYQRPQLQKPPQRLVCFERVIAVPLAKQPEAIPQHQLQQWFDQIDKSHKGSLSPEGLLFLCARLGLKLTAKEAEGLIHHIAPDKGCVDFPAFQQWWASRAT
eukprot:NODE_1593_length_1446_cov_88.016679_g1511_i0.p1 GENE.NODE_1593_length_1446_cov_88.016679_g1511_i0~~NODE_1593_length_1446_cov_88.016679_g1511_i0.p1  ORF type:complete len:413 (+),score=88.33 NODE_1593_length_1446_cov_88.016679_g1511_i0:110-1348(+)